MQPPRTPNPHSWRFRWFLKRRWQCAVPIRDHRRQWQSYHLLREAPESIPLRKSKSERRQGRPWVRATGTAATRSKKAGAYLFRVKFQSARRTEAPAKTLATAVCNLRNYHGQSLEQTVELVRSLYNPRAKTPWSVDAIRLTWELVEGFVPRLGLADERALAKKKAADLYDDVVDLIAYTRPGGRVPAAELYALFREWNPESDATPTAFGIAVHSVTGIRSKPSKGVRYYSGFHIQSADELLDQLHSSGQQQSSAPQAIPG